MKTPMRWMPELPEQGQVIEEQGEVVDSAIQERMNEPPDVIGNQGTPHADPSSAAVQ